LIVLGGQRVSLRAMPWGDDARRRVLEATAWWPIADLDARIDRLWSRTPTEEPGWIVTAERWNAIVAGESTTPDGTAIPRQVAVAIARLRREHPDPVATYNPITRRTSCCPTVTAHTAFQNEVVRPWPAIAGCPQCGRLIVPAEFTNQQAREVADWWGEHEPLPIDGAGDIE
jgi:hypothetical protein